MAVKKSATIVLFLDDETTKSTWVVHGTPAASHVTTHLIFCQTADYHTELRTAQENAIPIIAVIDIVSVARSDKCLLMIILCRIITTSAS
jgi:hypothetical protein